MHLPVWFTWQNVTPYITAIPGCVALWLTWRSDHVRLHFVFQGYKDVVGQDPETAEEYLTPAVYVTVTNEGKKRLTIERVTCDVDLGGCKPRRQIFRKAISPTIVLGQGEAHAVFIELPRLREGQTATFASMGVLDTTGKVWKLRRSEWKRLRAEERRIWPAEAGRKVERHLP